MKLIDDQKAIHPTDVFDMIAGTSVGALMAFALVGGKEKWKEGDGERVPMTLQEVVDFMKETTDEIWSGCGRLSAFWNTITSCTLQLHSRKGINNALQKTFSEAPLGSFKNNTCIAAAVARRFGCSDQDEEEKFDCLEIFDTRSDSQKNFKVTDVLKATSNAPIYFETPTMIKVEGSKTKELNTEESNTDELKTGESKTEESKTKEIPYVDGGLGGNCPIPQGLRRMKELRPGSKFGSGLSIAPPRTVLKSKPNGLYFWLNYFPQRTTDGMASYCEYKKQHLQGTNQRIFPRSEEAKQFKTDDKRVDEMIKCMEKERDTDPTYLEEIGKCALVWQYIIKTKVDLCLIVSAALVIAARVKGIDPVKLWRIAKVFTNLKLDPRKSTDGQLVSHSDNDLAIMYAMSKLKLDKTSSIRHDIILKKAQVQNAAKLYNEAQETLKPLKKVDWEGVDEITKEEMKALLKNIKENKKKEDGNFVTSHLDSDSDSDSDSD